MTLMCLSQTLEDGVWPFGCVFAESRAGLFNSILAGLILEYIFHISFMVVIINCS